MCILHWWSQCLMVYRNSFIVLFTLRDVHVSLHHAHVCQCTGHSPPTFKMKLKSTVRLEMLWPCSVCPLWRACLTAVTFSCQMQAPTIIIWFAFTQHTQWASSSHFIYKPNSNFNADRCQTKVNEWQGEPQLLDSPSVISEDMVEGYSAKWLHLYAHRIYNIYLFILH